MTFYLYFKHELQLTPKLPLPIITADAFEKKKGLLGYSVKANCPHVGPRPTGVVPSVRVFLRYPSPYLRQFRRKPRKTPNS